MSYDDWFFYSALLIGGVVGIVMVFLFIVMPLQAELQESESDKDLWELDSRCYRKAIMANGKFLIDKDYDSMTGDIGNCKLVERTGPISVTYYPSKQPVERECKTDEYGDLWCRDGESGWKYESSKLPVERECVPSTGDDSVWCKNEEDTWIKQTDGECVECYIVTPYQDFIDVFILEKRHPYDCELAAEMYDELDCLCKPCAGVLKE